MKELQVSALENDLTILEVALSRYTKAQEQLARAQLPYAHAIATLQEAMAQDGNVLQAMDTLEEYKDLYDEAEGNAKAMAVSAWRNDKTEGVKEGKQGKWEVRLRTTKTPKADNIPELITHLAELKAAGTVVRNVTFNKADTVKLHESIEGGIMGLNVEEKTTASLRQQE